MSVSEGMIETEVGGPVGKGRSFIIGCIMALIIGLSGPYWTVYLGSSRLWADYHTQGATFFMLLLFLLCNVFLGSFWRAARLKARELMFITAMMFAGGSIITSGTVAYLVPALAAPHYRADAGDTELIKPYLKSWLYPLDPDGGRVAITRFWQGLPQGEPIPWGPWVGPLLYWGVLLMALFALMTAVMVIMRKQWMDYEHLSFPIAQVPAELCASAAEPLGESSIFRSKAFWIGFGALFLLASIGGVLHYFDSSSQSYFRLRHTVALPWAGGRQENLSIYLDVVVIGLVFLIPNRVAFSVWSLALVGWLINAFLRTYGWDLTGQSMSYGGNALMQHVIMGALVAFVASNIWVSRRHLGRVLRCALGVGDRGYDDDEPSSYRTALVTIAISSAVSLVWLRQAGLRPFYGVCFLLAMLVVFYGIARVVAQCGLPTASAPTTPSGYVGSVFGAQNLGPEQVTVLGSQIAWHADVRNLAITGTSHGMYLVRKRRGGLFWGMMLAMAITYLVGTFFSVYLSYRKGGASTMDGWFYGNASRLGWRWATANLSNPQGPCYNGLMWGGLGAAVMAGLVLAHRTLFWWPIHPVGLLLCSTHMIRFFWISIFLAWLAKVVIVGLGGHSAYRPARRFFIGTVVGYVSAGGLWAILDTITGTMGNNVFYI